MTECEKDRIVICPDQQHEDEKKNCRRSILLHEFAEKRTACYIFFVLTKHE